MVSNQPSIQTFFSAHALPEASKRLRVLLKAAASTKVWKGGSPADLLWLCRDLQELVTTAFNIDARNKDPKAIINGQWEDAAWPLNSPDTFCGWQKGYTAWDFFPRHLSKKAFLNPYLAIEQFTSYRTEKEGSIYWTACWNMLTPISTMRSMGILIRWCRWRGSCFN